MNTTTAPENTPTIDLSNYGEYLIERTGKIPLCFRGVWLASSGFKDEEETEVEGEYGITVYKTVGLKYVVVVSEWRGQYETDRVTTMTANSTEELADQLQDGDLMRVDSYNAVAMHVLYQLFPDNPNYCETID